jgi:hypothetical protein
MKTNLIALAIGVAVGYFFAFNLKTLPIYSTINGNLNQNG